MYLFININDVINFVWHTDERKCDEMLYGEVDLS